MINLNHGYGHLQKWQAKTVPQSAQTPLEQSSANMSGTLGCKSLIVLRWVLDGEKM